MRKTADSAVARRSFGKMRCTADILLLDLGATVVEFLKMHLAAVTFR
jgi:hypothetical protein